jgi:hypothetical protein
MDQNKYWSEIRQCSLVSLFNPAINEISNKVGMEGGGGREIKKVHCRLHVDLETEEKLNSWNPIAKEYGQGCDYGHLKESRNKCQNESL